MIMDRLCEFADAAALNTGVPGSYVVGTTYDMTIPRDLGAGQTLYLVITVDTGVTSAGAATVEFQLKSDSVTPIVPGSSTLHLSTGALALADLAQGKVHIFALPGGGVAYERFLGLVQVTGVAALTAGKVNAFVTQDPHGWRSYAEGSN